MELGSVGFSEHLFAYISESFMWLPTLAAIGTIQGIDVNGCNIITEDAKQKLINIMTSWISLFSEATDEINLIYGKSIKTFIKDDIINRLKALLKLAEGLSNKDDCYILYLGL